MKRFWNAVNAFRTAERSPPTTMQTSAKADKSPREVFGSLSDEAWCTVLEASISEQVQKGVRLPGFADAALQSVTVGSSGLSALREAGKFYSYIRETCELHGTPLGPSTQILDFGVSWGRIIRFFLKDTEAVNLHGVDVSENYLAAARDTGCQATLQMITPLGTLPYADQTFDLVYAYSVFTHLPESVQDLWLREIQRVLKPKGLFVATVEPPRFIDFFRDIDPDDETRHPWHRQMARIIKTDPSIKADLDKTGFAHIKASDTYGDTIMTSEYAHRHWGELFEIIDFVDDPRRFWQAVVSSRRR